MLTVKIDDCYRVLKSDALHTSLFVKLIEVAMATGNCECYYSALALTTNVPIQLLKIEKAMHTRKRKEVEVARGTRKTNWFRQVMMCSSHLKLIRPCHTCTKQQFKMLSPLILRL